MFENLKPELFWKHFYNISQIPHPSKKEDKLIEYLIKFAIDTGFEYKKDNTGNVLITKPAKEGKEGSPAVVLQSHIDMVCEKNEDVVHDFENDPLILNIKDGWVSAEGTTLGADDGVGVAASLAVLESNDLVHGKIECLFTVDEETGLNGANGLKNGFFTAEKLLNLDSEEEGAVYIGCAGGKTTILNKKISKSENTFEGSTYRIKVIGLQGGHSGLAINKGLGNALKLLGRFLWNLNEKFDYNLSKFAGGDKHNAIPREAFADITVKDQDLPVLESEIKKYSAIFKTEFRSTDPKVQLIKKKINKHGNVFSEKDKQNLLNLIYTIPAGVMAMSSDIPGLVETSTNLAALNESGDTIKILTSQRSSVATSIKDISDKIIAIGMLSGYEYQTEDPYPSWMPNPDSDLVKLISKEYKELFEEEIEIKAVHAGLECGIIGEKYPGIDMISFGPTVVGAHSPDEKLNISSVEKFWLILINILENI